MFGNSMRKNIQILRCAKMSTREICQISNKCYNHTRTLFCVFLEISVRIISFISAVEGGAFKRSFISHAKSSIIFLLNYPVVFSDWNAPNVEIVFLNGGDK